MAGDWIKWTKGLVDHPKVVRISSALNADRMRTASALMVLWEWADGITANGIVTGVSASIVDDVSRTPGLSKAMMSVGWLVEDAQGLVFPDFERHNGQSAKRRAMEAERKRGRRTSAFDADILRTKSGPEKRREEKSTDKQKKQLGGESEIGWDVSFGFRGVTAELRGQWAKAYPACDIDQQLARMDQWLKFNPERAVKKNWGRFITNWLTKSQERGGDIQTPRNGRGPRTPAAGVAKASDRRQVREAGQYPEEFGHVRTIDGSVPGGGGDQQGPGTAQAGSGAGRLPTYG